MKLLIFYGGDSIESDYSREAFSSLKTQISSYFDSIIGCDINELKNYSTDLRIISQADVAMSLVYGNPGQDGSIQGILNLLRIPYIGSDIFACAMIKDKFQAKRFVKEIGLHTSKDITVSEYNYHGINLKTLMDKAGICFPVVVKPRSMGGLSLGITYCSTIEEARHALEVAFRYDTDALMEEYIEGKEVTVCIVDIDHKAKALSPIEVIKEGPISDYEAKKNHTRQLKIEKTSLDSYEVELVKGAARRIFKELGMRDYGYFDFIIRKKKCYFIEAGATPGFTKGSNIPVLIRQQHLKLGKLILNIANEHLAM